MSRRWSKGERSRQAGSEGGGWQQGGRVGTDGLFTKGSGATGMLYISSVSCPGFPTYRGEKRGIKSKRRPNSSLTSSF